jgi:thiol-disulfide isomerase/thioredoxin
MGIELVDTNDYQSFVESYPHVVIHFWADWNLYERDIRERLSDMSEIYADSIKFGSFDTSPKQHWEKCHELHILNLPTLVFYKHGEVLNIATGLESIEKQKLI